MFSINVGCEISWSWMQVVLQNLCTLFIRAVWFLFSFWNQWLISGLFHISVYNHIYPFIQCFHTPRHNCFPVFYLLSYSLLSYSLPHFLLLTFFSSVLLCLTLFSLALSIEAWTSLCNPFLFHSSLCLCVSYLLSSSWDFFLGVISSLAKLKLWQSLIWLFNVLLHLFEYNPFDFLNSPSAELCLLGNMKLDKTRLFTKHKSLKFSSFWWWFPFDAFSMLCPFLGYSMLNWHLQYINHVLIFF